MRQQQLTFTLPLPPSINAAYADVIKVTPEGKRYTRRIASKPLQRFKYSAPLLLFEQGICRDYWQHACSVGYQVDVYVKTRRSDLSNRIKAYEDAVCTYLGFDDSRIDESHIYRHIDKERPRIDGRWYLIDAS